MLIMQMFYTAWNGERKQSQKRGCKTKREAQVWERVEIISFSKNISEPRAGKILYGVIIIAAIISTRNILCRFGLFSEKFNPRKKSISV